MFGEADLGAYVIPATLGAWFVLLLFAELLFPLRKRKRPWLSHVFVNLIVTALGFAVGSLATRPAALFVMRWSESASVGLLNVVDLPPWAKMALGILLMDLTFYYWHRANHKVGVLWRFHNAHHSDPDLDVTTGFRFHFGEVLYSSAFRAVQVAAIGVSLEVYVAYEIVFQCATGFHHSNVRLPLFVEKLMSRITVTPRMHGIHHSSFMDEADSNCSVIFMWWDRLHGTLRLNVPQADIRIGVPAYAEARDNSVWRILTMPFRRQRNHWPAGTRSRPADATSADVPPSSLVA